MKLINLVFVLTVFVGGCQKSVVQDGESLEVMQLLGKRDAALGTFEISSSTMIVSDPALTVDMINKLGLAVVVERCRIGRWFAKCVVKQFSPDKCEFLSELIVIHESVGRSEALSWTQIKGEVGVDSGQAGIWDRDRFADASIVPKNLVWTFETNGKMGPAVPDDLWYSWCCELTKTAKDRAAVMLNGVVSISGKGDGGYNLYASRDAAGEVVGLKIVFIDDDGKG